MSRKNSLLAGVSALFAGLFGSMTSAVAQDVRGATASEVVVTGSRVPKNGNEMPTPVTVVLAEELLTTKPSNVIDALQTLPVFQGSTGPVGASGNPSGNSAARTLNLRNLGANRGLVLFDGRRVAPSSPTGGVTVDFVPSMLLQRVDVVTGGASAVYGSDAVAGVVNFITDRTFNGLKLNAQGGVSDIGDAKEYRFGIAGGTQLFGGRGHIEGSWEHYDQEGIFTKATRDWASRRVTVQGSGTVAVPNRLVENTTQNLWSLAGHITSAGPFQDQIFRENGVATPFIHGSPRVGSAESGGDGYFFQPTSLLGATRSNQFFGRFDYDLTDSVHAYVEGTYNTNRNLVAFGYPGIFSPIQISNQQAYLPASMRTVLPATGSFRFSKILGQANASRPETETRGHLLNFGLEGEIGDKWKWDVSYVNTKNRQVTGTQSNLNNERLQAALDAVVDPATGRIVCNISLVNPARLPGCVPLNPFGPTSASAAAIAYVTGPTSFTTTTKLDNVGASISGAPLELWAGPLQVALSAEWRKLSFTTTSTAQPTDVVNCSQLRFCDVQSLWVQNVISNAAGDQTVSEGALEVELPLLADVPFFQNLSLNGAARYTDYDTSGNVWTWKLGSTWDLNDQVTLRATRSRDIRAPNLNELFAPTSVGPIAGNDIHITDPAGRVGLANVVSSGNPTLRPEVARTWTAGLVLKPLFLPNFTLAIDWYELTILDAVTNLSGAAQTVQQLCEDSNGASEYCTLILRPLPFSDRSNANRATTYLSRPINSAVTKTDGIDVETNYRQDLFDGTLSFRGLFSFQPRFTTRQFPGAPVFDTSGVVGFPNQRIQLNLSYAKGPVTVSISEQITGKVRFNSNPAIVYTMPEIKARGYTSLNLNYAIPPIYGSDQANLFFNVQNLFDTEPRPWGGGGTPSLGSDTVGGDDIIGRYYSLGFRLRY